MKNYQLFRILRDDFFCTLVDSRFTDEQKSQIREMFTTSFMDTLLYLLEKKDEELKDTEEVLEKLT
jgi:hypothetical protein